MQAVVDIGSNSIKFTVADVQRAVPAVMRKKSWITRLGRGLEKSGFLAPEAIAETEKALLEMAKELEPFRPDLKIQVVATSAVRDCKNPEEISERVQRILGVPLRVLTGVEEARYSLTGAASAAELFYQTRDCVFVDVGGASTEVGVVEPEFAAFSFQAGAVRCHEGLGLDQIPVTDEAWARAHRDIEKFFPMESWTPLVAKIPVTHRRAVAVGGSLLVAARLAGAHVASISDTQTLGFSITVAQMEQFNDQFRRLPMEERLRRPSMERGRADILCAGILCLTTVLNRLDVKDVLITDWGLRHGLLLSAR